VENGLDGDTKRGFSRASLNAESREAVVDTSAVAQIASGVKNGGGWHRFGSRHRDREMFGVEKGRKRELILPGELVQLSWAGFRVDGNVLPVNPIAGKSFVESRDLGHVGASNRAIEQADDEHGGLCTDQDRSEASGLILQFDIRGGEEDQRRKDHAYEYAGTTVWRCALDCSAASMIAMMRRACSGFTSRSAPLVRWAKMLS